MARRPLRQRLPKVITALLGLIPATRTAALFFTDGLGANPIAEAMNQLGFWTLTLLLASLACTPLKLVAGWTWPIKIRKMLGLLAFFYATLHFAMYFGVDQFFDFEEIGKDIVKRKFITVGFAAFLILIPLAITSPSRMVKRMGFPRWKRLHRLVYLAATLGVIHFVWRVKSDYRQPILFGFVLAVLLLIRVVAHLRGGAARRAAASS